ncbi:MAG TPA: ABC transporter ATP-binding protein [Acidothermaceae bacterium]
MANDQFGSALELRELSKYYDDVVAVRDVSLHIDSGEFVTLLGPSGSGKTTTLNLVAGLAEPTSGEILLGGRDISRIPPHQRDIGVVFQGYLLFPHMNVFKNVAYPLVRRGVPKEERRRRVMEALELVHLERLADRFPRQLSGGEQQRVALARAIVFRPPVLLMDEPMGALDRKLRENLQWELKRIQRETKITCLYVTHDQEEALVLSDRIAIFSNGEIEQVGTADDLYERPVSMFVARFVGDSNCFAGRVESDSASTRIVADTFSLKVPSPSGVTLGATATVLVRPERMRVHPLDAGTGDNVLQGRVRSVTYLGPARRIEVSVPGINDVIVREPTNLGPPLRVGDGADVVWSVRDSWLIPAAPSDAAAVDVEPPVSGGQPAFAATPDEPARVPDLGDGRA